LFEGSTASEAYKRKGKQYDLNKCTKTNSLLGAFTLDKNTIKNSIKPDV